MASPLTSHVKGGGLFCFDGVDMSSGKLRFLTLVKPVLCVLPEVAQPDRKIPFKVCTPLIESPRPAAAHCAALQPT